MQTSYFIFTSVLKHLDVGFSFIFNQCMFCFLIFNARQVDRLVSGRNGRSIVDLYAHLRAKSPESCRTRHDPMDCTPPGFSVHGIL